MSRSRKKHPIIKDGTKAKKQMANRRFRRVLKQRKEDEVLPLMREITNQYDVIDWVYLPRNKKDERKFRRK